MNATATINGKEIEIFVHDIICKDGQRVAIVNKGTKKSMFTFGVKLASTNIIEV